MIKVFKTRMYSQTIALFRYLLLGILNRRFFVLLSVLYLAGLILSGFISELAIINSRSISDGFLADFIRYSLVLLMLLMIVTHVSDDFEFKQFERLLTMPVSRWQYVVAQYMVTAVTALLLVLPCLIIFMFLVDIEIVSYWVASLWLEVFLVGLIGFLAVLSLEKVPVAVIFSISVYLLSKLSGLISQMLAESVLLSDGGLTNRFAETIFEWILYLLPGLETYAQNDVFFKNMDTTTLLVTQAQSVLVYALFILVVCLVDFYRKEFNL